jgi:hypothetical protein
MRARMKGIEISRTIAILSGVMFSAGIAKSQNAITTPMAAANV